jgi:hypothetical protein
VAICEFVICGFAICRPNIFCDLWICDLLTQIICELKTYANLQILYFSAYKYKILPNKLAAEFLDSFCRIPIRHFFSQSRRLLTKIFESEATVNEKCRWCEFRGEGNKTGVAMLVISLSLFHKTRDTQNWVNREVPKIL